MTTKQIMKPSKKSTFVSKSVCFWVLVFAVIFISTPSFFLFPSIINRYTLGLYIISLIEAFYIIYTFTIFQSVYNFNWFGGLLIEKLTVLVGQNKWLSHGHFPEELKQLNPRNQLCLLGQIMGVVAGLFLLIRGNIIIFTGTYNKDLFYCGSVLFLVFGVLMGIILNANVLVYLLPIIVMEGITYFLRYKLLKLLESQKIKPSLPPVSLTNSFPVQTSLPLSMTTIQPTWTPVI